MTYSVAHIESSIDIDCPARDVWAAVQDYAFDFRWRTGLVEMSAVPPGPAATGTRVHEVVRKAGRLYTADSVVDEIAPDSRYHFTGRGTSGDISGYRSVASEPSGLSARFTYGVDIRPPMPIWLLAPLIALVVRRGMRRDLQRLKQVLEGQRAVCGQSASTDRAS